MNDKVVETADSELIIEFFVDTTRINTGKPSYYAKLGHDHLDLLWLHQFLRVGDGDRHQSRDCNLEIEISGHVWNLYVS